MKTGKTKPSSIALVAGKQVTMSVKNTRISGNGGYGVYVSYGASANTDLTTANTFEANAQANVMIDK